MPIYLVVKICQIIEKIIIIIAANIYCALSLHKSEYAQKTYLIN